MKNSYFMNLTQERKLALKDSSEGLPTLNPGAKETAREEFPAQEIPVKVKPS